MRKFRYLFLIALALLSFTEVFGQKNKREAVSLEISVQVVDPSGNPVKGAELSVAEGKRHYTTDDEGMARFSCASKDVVKISCKGYITTTILSTILVDTGSIILSEDVLFAGENDNLQLPFDVEKRRYSAGSTITIKGEDLCKYSSVDIRNTLTGVIPGVVVTENYGQVGLSPLEHTGQYGASSSISVTSRGKQVMYIVDDVPVNIDETPLDPEQIESVTIVRDAMEKAMYGATAADGIIYIRTKRGKYNDRYLNVGVESGIFATDRMARFVDAATYARLNNVARDNSGMSPLYTREDVAAYAKNDPNDPLHPSVNYHDMMLKNVMPYVKANVASGGGNDIVRYYAYMSYKMQDDMYKIGPKADYNSFNINANLDVKLHKYIRVDFGILSSLGVRKSSNYGYSPNYTSEDASSNTTLGIAEMPAVLGHITTIPQLAFPVRVSQTEESEFPWYGVSSQYTQNPIANILENGSYTETTRKALFNVGLNIDFSFLTPGLSSLTYGAYDATNLVRLGTAEDYAAYIITTEKDITGQSYVVPVQSSSHSVVSMSQKAKLLDYFASRFFFMQKFAYERSFGPHAVKASADFMITKRSQKFITEHRREMNIGLNGSYVYDGRYAVKFSLNEHGTYSLLKPWYFSPTAGAAWIMSQEKFMQDAKWLDFLKFRVEGGLLHYDSLTSANRDVDNYSWNNSGASFGPYTTNQWFGTDRGSSTNRTYISMLGNSDLALEKRKEVVGGFDMTALRQRLNVSFSYWYNVAEGQITQMSNTIPLTTGTTIGALYMNYNSTMRHGLEASIGWSDKVGDFSYSVGGWASTLYSKVLKIDQVNYKEAYRNRVGKSATAIWGLQYMGQFASDEEALSSNQLFDDALKAGDFRYRDMDGDGFVDDSDACVIGDSAPKLNYALNLHFGYKGIDLSIVGTGKAFYQIQLTNSYYWNGWGDSNYSYYTASRVSDPTAPRLTYNKVNNNFKLSDYWLADGSFFKIQSIELGYSFPVARWNIDKVLRAARIYVRSNNVVTFSGIKDLDPESLSAGLTNYPLMRTVVGGLTLTF